MSYEKEPVSSREKNHSKPAWRPGKNLESVGLNLAAHILDPIGALTQLWEPALAENERQTGLDPAVVVKFVRQAILLMGNASFCGLSDCRKSLLAKVSLESLDLLDERNLFQKNSAELFGKRLMLKEFKHDKIMDNLFGRSSHSNRKQFFCQQPGPDYQVCNPKQLRKQDL